ncbi:Multiple C2 and transmembrane domain-containing protein 1 [Holothuria leucospilota]|uniref:Multiple C2 and transmembrane domain-containing protein 1 n=1 Tax=Holothuria leucospilota TaxID=206669 RepID=A0A9Q1H0M5_HOLLE|nr:Multiple C2 and transmembrane domain-containing protein 1 [Holothuria leucospilota]
MEETHALENTDPPEEEILDGSRVKEKKKKKKKGIWGSLRNISKITGHHHEHKKEKNGKDKEEKEEKDEVWRRRDIKGNRKLSKHRPVSSLSDDGINPNLLMPPTIVFHDSSDSEDDFTTGNITRSKSEQKLSTIQNEFNGYVTHRKPLSVRKRFLERKQSRQSSAESDQADTPSSPQPVMDGNATTNSDAEPGDKDKTKILSSSPSKTSLEGSVEHLRMEKEAVDEESEMVKNPPTYYRLEVHLKEGKDLAVRDWSGSSDPYVKLKLGGKVVYKSRIIYQNLNPLWDEHFQVPVRNVNQVLSIAVLDYDVGPVSDDPMGRSKLNLSSLEPGILMEKKFELHESNTTDYLGYLLMDFKLVSVSEDELQNISSRRKQQTTAKRASLRASNSKSQLWTSVVTIALLEGKNLIPMDDNGLSDPYVKFKLGGEKFKSKVESKTLSPKWMEQFDLKIYEDQSQILEISVWDKDVGKDDIMGRGEVDLSTLEPERTHFLEVELEDNAGVVELLLTITGTSGEESISDLGSFVEDPNRERELIKRYSIKNSFREIKDVGWLQVKVIKAQNLASADIGGKSDPFCVVELVNSRLQTQTQYKTLNPEWGKVFTFQVKDIHTTLEVTVFDEDKHGSPEFLGKCAIPLLKIRNGEKRFYALKDKKLQGRAKGCILLEMDVIYNDVKAAIRTVNPKEVKYMEQEPKFKISILQKNLSRVTAMVGSVLEVGRFINSCFQWESKPRTITAFISFLVIVWNFELYMLPISILLVFLWKYVEISISEKYNKPQEEEEYADSDEEEDETSEGKVAKLNPMTAQDLSSFTIKHPNVHVYTHLLRNCFFTF